MLSASDRHLCLGGGLGVVSENANACPARISLHVTCRLPHMLLSKCLHLVVPRKHMKPSDWCQGWNSYAVSKHEMLGWQGMSLEKWFGHIWTLVTYLTINTSQLAGYFRKTWSTYDDAATQSAVGDKLSFLTNVCPSVRLLG